MCVSCNRQLCVCVCVCVLQQIADLPLTFLGAPVDIGALLKPGSLSLGKAKTETGLGTLPGQDLSSRHRLQFSRESSDERWKN